MKTFVTGFWSLFLFIFGVTVGAAQEPPATPPPQEQQQPTPSPSTRPLPPPIPKIPDVRQPGEVGYWIGVMGWFPVGDPTIDKGRGAGFTDTTKTKLAGRPTVVEGAEIGIALGLHNALRISGFQGRAAGNLTLPGDVRIWDHAYTAGTNLSTNYRIQNAKISFEYLTWPYPVESRKFRLKTLWQVQYVGFRTAFDAPALPLVDSSGNPLLDSAGNPVNYASAGSRYFISPTIGIGVAEYASRHVRLEANATGFAIPHHTTLWDADASANLRMGHFELGVGAKAFHFKTSTQADFYLRGTLGSAFVALKWYSQ